MEAMREPKMGRIQKYQRLELVGLSAAAKRPD